MTSTVITALYDIKRDTEGDGRTIEEYLLWFEKTLKLNVPMVVFTEKKFKDFVLKHRKDNVHLVVKPLTKVPYYKYLKKISNILNSEEYKTKIAASFRVECKLPLYNVIQYSKFDWITETITNKYFDTDYYFWMDAGCSRFFEDVNLNNPWPKNYSILSPTQFNIQGNWHTLYYNIPDIENYFWDTYCLLVGGLFGGTKNVCFDMANRVKTKFEDCLKNNVVNNEQVMLGYIFKKHPHLFNIYIELNGQTLPLFKKLAQ